jgi:phosphohistidine phosphatase
MTDPDKLSLHLLRHADAGDPEAWQGDDAARPLSEKGVRQAEALGRHLALVEFETDAILSSPRLRALQTAQILGKALGLKPTIDERLGGSLDLRLVAAMLQDAGGPANPVLVGHDPDFSELLAELTGAPRMSMKKGAIARVDVRGGVRSGSGVLRWLLPPDLVLAQDRPSAGGTSVKARPATGSSKTASEERGRAPRRSPAGRSRQPHT